MRFLTISNGNPQINRQVQSKVTELLFLLRSH